MLNSWRLAVLCVAGLVAWLGGGQAQAMMGYGGFGGFGFGLGPQTPASVSFINQHAIAQMGVAAAARPKPLRAPTAVVRDVEFFNRYDAATRRAMVDAASRRRSPSPARAALNATPAAAEPVQPPRPVVPLVSFFNKMRELIWPADSPTAGDLAGKRSTSDETTLALLHEIENQGYAHIASVTDARNKLLEYGRPALQYVRDNSTAGLGRLSHLSALALRFDRAVARSTAPVTQASAERRRGQRPPIAPSITRILHRRGSTSGRPWARKLAGHSARNAGERGPYRPTARPTALSRLACVRSRLMTFPSRPMRTFPGTSVTAKAPA